MTEHYRLIPPNGFFLYATERTTCFSSRKCSRFSACVLKCGHSTCGSFWQGQSVLGMFWICWLEPSIAPLCSRWERSWAELTILLQACERSRTLGKWCSAKVACRFGLHCISKLMAVGFHFISSKSPEFSQGPGAPLPWCQPGWCRCNPSHSPSV